MSKLRIGGLVRFSANDYPGALAAVVFCQGCPWNCEYCHNPNLLAPAPASSLNWDEVLHFLEKRSGLLDSVVFSGGEPTLQSGLLDAIGQVKNMGFRVGLHTSGAYPERLQELLANIDWVGLDIKAPFSRYEKITGVTGSGERALASALMVERDPADFEFRTTLHPALTSEKILEEVADELSKIGGGKWQIQPFSARGSRIGGVSRVRMEGLAGRLARGNLQVAVRC